MLLNIKDKLIKREIIAYSKCDGLSIILHTSEGEIELQAKDEDEIDKVLCFLADETYKVKREFSAIFYQEDNSLEQDINENENEDENEDEFIDKIKTSVEIKKTISQNYL